MMGTKALLAAASAAALLLASQANAASILAMKLSDLTPDASSAGRLDAYSGWTDGTGWNEGVAGATDLVNNGIDYRNGSIDWAEVESVRVSMYSQGSEVAYVEFDAAGTTMTDFFAVANVSGSSWPDDLTTDVHNYFSIAGHTSNDRHWYINRNYGGCGSDVGHMVVLDGDGADACSWETTRTDDIGLTNRGFLYSTLTTDTNWNNTGGQVGVADVFAVHVTVGGDVPLPASLVLMGTALGGLGAARRFARKAG
ncbi:hypothetical protein RGUI_1825 [Rhodovulum sp. P5]|uniref:VPLPA-CTERM sorting domain-containing protein n=1 Tax=Rhodovulum sp. P5 TaxID=1564506 RepID=UPI0009C3B8D3|nr:VPLPA-CTERM sorting domain-containing protein [Rhodovulum sp. P5]ARE39966.1 hypothetical protein RGUI_1825 [Rhodovulum sp. P5]